MKGKNVLLIDDDHICNFINKKALESLGFVKDIHTALNGNEALQLFNNYYQGTIVLPDIILLDLNMPVMDGFEFLEMFRSLNLPNKELVKIIIVTSSDNPADIARAKEFGIGRYLQKPLSKESLLNALEMT